MKVLLDANGGALSAAPQNPNWRVPDGCRVIDVAATLDDFVNAAAPPGVQLDPAQPKETYWDAAAAAFYLRNRAPNALELAARQRADWKTLADQVSALMDTKGWDGLTPAQRTAFVKAMCQTVSALLAHG